MAVLDDRPKKFLRYLIATSCVHFLKNSVNLKDVAMYRCYHQKYMNYYLHLTILVLKGKLSTRWPSYISIAKLRGQIDLR